MQYMAPEQLEGKEVDARTDIFAFGAVTYEMATGKKCFEGKSQASLIAAILEREPPAMSSVQPMTPPALDRVVKKCLAKEPENRWQTPKDLCDELKWIAEGGPQVTLAPAAAAKGVRALGRRWLIVARRIAVRCGDCEFCHVESEALTYGSGTASQPHCDNATDGPAAECWSRYRPCCSSFSRWQPSCL
jgi:hypothetical protein